MKSLLLVLYNYLLVQQRLYLESVSAAKTIVAILLQNLIVNNLYRFVFPEKS